MSAVVPFAWIRTFFSVYAFVTTFVTTTSSVPPTDTVPLPAAPAASAVTNSFESARISTAPAA